MTGKHGYIKNKKRKTLQLYIVTLQQVITFKYIL